MDSQKQSFHGNPRPQSNTEHPMIEGEGRDSLKVGVGVKMFLFGVLFLEQGQGWIFFRRYSYLYVGLCGENEVSFERKLTAAGWMGVHSSEMRQNKNKKCT